MEVEWAAVDVAGEADGGWEIALACREEGLGTPIEWVEKSVFGLMRC